MRLVTNALCLVLSLVWGYGAYATEPTVYPEQGVQVFLGLDDTSAPTQVQDGRAQALQNVLLSVSKDLRQRYGYSLPVTVGTDKLALKDTLDIQDEAFCAVTGIYYTKFSSGTERIIGTCSNRFYYLNGVTSWAQVYGATITGGKNNQFVWTTALDNIIGTNQADTPIRYDGTTLTTVSFTGLSNAIQTAKTVAFFKNYLVFGNTKENNIQYSTRLRWSNVGTINTWTDADYIDIGALGGQEIVSMAELYDNLYIFLTDSIYKVSLVGGTDTYQISKVTDDIGCIAKNSVQGITLTNAQNGLVFLDKDKRIYFFNGVIAQDISTLIRTTMDALSGTRLQYAVSADTNSDYVLCLTNGTGTENNLCLDLEYEIGEWTKHTNVPANAMGSVLDNNSLSQVYFGSYKSLVYQYQNTSLRDDVGTFTGTVGTVSVFTTATTSGLTILYNPAWSLVTGLLVGAPIELIGGTGATQTNTIADNTTTGLVVTDTFTTTPDSTTTFEVGAIDSFYTTKWYDFGQAARLKHFGEVYFWADADVSSTHSVSYATDYSSDVATLSLVLSSSTSDAIWGSAVWGVALWGDTDTVFRQGKLEAQGRYLRLKFAEDDPAENFRIYGFNILAWPGDVN